MTLEVVSLKMGLKGWERAGFVFGYETILSQVIVFILVVAYVMTKITFSCKHKVQVQLRDMKKSSRDIDSEKTSEKVTKNLNSGLKLRRLS